MPNMSEAPEGKIGNWYDPSKNDEGLHRTCCVVGCGRAAAYNLCPEHAFPGRVVQVARDGNFSHFVIGSWVVKRKGERHMLLLNDFALGDIFGARAQAERYLAENSYTVLEFIATENAELTMNIRYPCLTLMHWPMDLVDGYSPTGTPIGK